MGHLTLLAKLKWNTIDCSKIDKVLKTEWILLRQKSKYKFNNDIVQQNRDRILIIVTVGVFSFIDGVTKTMLLYYVLESQSTQV